MEYSYTNYFAEIYDEVMGNVPYKFWFRYLSDLLNYYKHHPKSVLELASGTSNMTFKLFNLNSLNKITALDLSESMLDKALEKLEIKLLDSDQLKKLRSDREAKNYLIELKKRKIEVDFIKQNMKDFSFNHKYDLILSFFDSLNYLIDINDLEACFKSAANSLEEDGLFIFDMNSLGRIKTIGNKSFVINGGAYECLWQDIVKESENLWQVKLKICPNNEQLPCFEELHSERGYKISTIIRLLKNSGFKAVDVYNAFSFAKGRNNSERLYFAAALNSDKLENNKGKMNKLYYGVKNRIDYFLVSLKHLF